MKITVCIGDSCQVKGARRVVEQLQEMITENDLKDKVQLCGAPCMGDCQNGVCVTIDDELFSVAPETAGRFFHDHVLTRLG